MKTWLVVLFSTFAGLGIGSGATYVRFELKATNPASLVTTRMVPGTNLPYKPKESGPIPKAVVDEEEHDFGTIEQNSRVQHTFKISNVGWYPLVIESGGTSCGKCTFTDLKEERVIQPQQSTDVMVEYNALAVADHFTQGATLITNDPERPRIHLALTGRVRSSYQLIPSKLTIGRMTAADSRTLELLVLANLIDNLQVSKPEFEVKNIAENFSAEITPLTGDELPKEAKSGALVKIVVKPGLPLGAVRQTIRLATNLPGHEELEVPIEIVVGGDISISGGSDHDDNTKVLRLDAISAKTGAKQLLLITIVGEDREGVEFKVVKRDPEWLKAEIGQAITVGKSVRFPLMIEIPPGSPATIRMGTMQGKSGVIELESTHPQAKQLKILVQFAVQE